MKHNHHVDDASTSSTESMVAQAVDEFLEHASLGQQPDVEEYAARFPQIANVLRDVLPAMVVMHESDAVVPPADRSLADQFVDGCLGDYRILHEIGRGGMGVVYEAEQISLQRRVALKVLPFAAALDPKRLERFKNEAQAAARLHHSNIVPVYAVGCERGVYYYAMQVIDGESLADVIHQLNVLAEPPDHQRPRHSPSSVASHKKDNNQGSVEHADPKAPTSGEGRSRPNDAAVDPSEPPPNSYSTETLAHGRAAISTMHSTKTPAFYQKVAELGIQAAQGLEYAHSQGVVHRDIKPANLMVDSRGQLWITDFGLARLSSDAGVTMTGDILGTLRYMSPEQAQGKSGVVDHHSDIYSLGATLYELLTLKPVFDGENREQLLRQIIVKDPVPPRRINRSIPTDLETIILKALAKEPHARYDASGEMADDLRRFLGSRPILAKRPSLLERASKWSRRHRSLVATAVVVLLLAFIGLIVSHVRIHREKAKTDAMYSEDHRRQVVVWQFLQKEEGLHAQTKDELKKALQRVDQFTELCAEELAEHEDLGDLRRDLLQSNLKFYQDLIEYVGDDFSRQIELAKSHFRIAMLLYEITSSSSDEAGIEQAIRTQEEFLRNHPDNPELKVMLFDMYSHLGVMQGLWHLHLAYQPSVQLHLGLSDTQMKNISKIVQQIAPAHEEFSGSDNANLGSRRRDFQEQIMAGHVALTEILDQHQMKRLDQIVRQFQVEKAFRDPQVVSLLGLSHSQRASIRRILYDVSRGRKMSPVQRGQHSVEQMQQRIYALLTSQQQAHWQELIGDPFQGDVEQPFWDA